MAITIKKRLFAQAIFDGDGKVSAADAARAAGYSEKTVLKTSYLLMKDPEIVGYIEYLRKNQKNDEEAAESGGFSYADDDSPLDFLLKVMRDTGVPIERRITAASQALPYVHAKIAQKGKKDEEQDAAKKASNLFSPQKAPRSGKWLN